MLDFVVQGLVDLLPGPIRWLVTAVLVVLLVVILGYAWSQGGLRW